MADEKLRTMLTLEGFDNLPQPVVAMLKHDFMEQGYALLSILEMPDRVIATLVTTKIFPSVPIEFVETDVKTAVAKVETKFAEMYPKHVCTAACDLHWQSLQSGSDGPTPFNSFS